MAEYLTLDVDTGRPPEELTAALNSYGAQGWRQNAVQMLTYNKRRVVFVKAGITEYLVVDYDVGKSAEMVTADLNRYGAEGWGLASITMIKQNKQRAVFIKSDAQSGGGSGGIPEAPQDSFTYGRMDATCNRAIAYDNDEVNGGDF